jgi:hypothetical protein
VAWTSRGDGTLQKGADVELQPATVEQVRIAYETNEWVVISADSSATVSEIQRIDPTLRVRFSPRARMFAVYHEHAPIPPILTVRAYQNRSGTWEGLDNRVVRRLQYIDSHGTSDYDFAKEIERETLARHERASSEFAERTGDGMERMAHAIRRDLGLGAYRGRVFIPREIR